MLRTIVGTIGLILLVGCVQAQEVELSENSSEQSSIRIIPLDDASGQHSLRLLSRNYTIDSAKAARNKACLATGHTLANCTCRTEAAAKFLPKDDFFEETRYIELGNDAAVAEFKHRMMVTKPKIMLRLGSALSECPGMFLELE